MPVESREVIRVGGRRVERVILACQVTKAASEDVSELLEWEEKGYELVNVYDATFGGNGAGRYILHKEISGSKPKAPRTVIKHVYENIVLDAPLEGYAMQGLREKMEQGYTVDSTEIVTGPDGRGVMRYRMSREIGSKLERVQ